MACDCCVSPANYYDDLAARFGLEPEFLEELRSLDLLFDRDRDGDFLHFYTETVGGVFFEVVERRGRYEGYGAPNAPIRLAAQLSPLARPVPQLDDPADAPWRSRRRPARPPAVSATI